MIKNAVDFIIKYEEGMCSELEIIDGFQYLIDSGIIFSLQGSYQRMAKTLIENDHCYEPSQERRLKFKYKMVSEAL